MRKFIKLSNSNFFIRVIEVLLNSVICNLISYEILIFHKDILINVYKKNTFSFAPKLWTITLIKLTKNWYFLLKRKLAYKFRYSFFSINFKSVVVNAELLYLYSGIRFSIFILMWIAHIRKIHSLEFWSKKPKTIWSLFETYFLQSWQTDNKSSISPTFNSNNFQLYMMRVRENLVQRNLKRQHP